MSFELASPPLAARSSDSTSGCRLAIVGGGPRGLYCLESLARLVGNRPSSHPLWVTMYEPSPSLGAGNIYETTQPHCLRMNFAAKHINAWSPDAISDPSRPSLIQWLDDLYPALADPDATLPRAIVGEYLSDCFDRVTRSLPPWVRLRIRRTRVSHIRRRAAQWELTTAAGTCQRFDEVMLTVGHQGWRGSAAHVYPVTEQLTAAQVPRGSIVSIRGFALTWIDATLALTEGRGGNFHSTRWGYQYKPSGAEPEKIIPRSRSFRPMLAKPDESKISYCETCQSTWQHHRRLIGGLKRPDAGFDFMRTIWPIVLSAASAALERIGASDDVDGWIQHWVSGAMSAAQAESQMRASYEVATGHCGPGAAWAMGESWRQLYAPMVDRISHGGLAVSSWQDFRFVAREMERIAFGPPADNLGRMLSLIDAGILDLSGEYSELQSEVVHLDAVIAAPSDSPATSPIQCLLQSGIVHRIDGGEGIEVDRCARPIGSDGRAVGGLAILGRPTEGCIVGNDTLSRTLHRHPERWAESVLHSLQISQNCHA